MQLPGAVRRPGATRPRVSRHVAYMRDWRAARKLPAAASAGRSVQLSASEAAELGGMFAGGQDAP